MCVGREIRVLFLLLLTRWPDAPPLSPLCCCSIDLPPLLSSFTLTLFFTSVLAAVFLPPPSFRVRFVMSETQHSLRHCPAPLPHYSFLVQSKAWWLIDLKDVQQQSKKLPPPTDDQTLRTDPFRLWFSNSPIQTVWFAYWCQSRITELNFCLLRLWNLYVLPVWLLGATWAVSPLGVCSSLPRWLDLKQVLLP